MEKQKKQNQEKNKEPCVKCGSSFVYIRIKDQQRVCRSCGNIEDLKSE